MIQKFLPPRLAIVISCIILCGFMVTRCVQKGKDREQAAAPAPGTTTNRNIQFDQYAGSASCSSCHKEIYETHVQTAHYKSSQPANEKTVLGSFSAGKNQYMYNPALRISMEKRDSGLYQSVYFKGEKKKDIRFDIVTGSGAKGQTFLYWDHDKLFQMPISYFTAPDQWSVSPGFRKDRVVLDKPITSRCLECHATFAGFLSAPDIRNEEFDRNKLLFGIDCEKCHGPAAEHVAFHSKNPQDSQRRHIIDPSLFSRQQKLDMCVLCHGGNIQKIKPSFEFLPGDKLAAYFAIDTASAAPNPDNIDVHGNQFGLLSASPCFKQSDMTCMTCHNSHENERDRLEVFSSRCMGCHNSEHNSFCKISPRPVAIEKNCIDCHMPKKPSMSVTLFIQGQETPAAAMVRSHFISIYPDESKKLRSVMEKSR